MAVAMKPLIRLAGWAVLAPAVCGLLGSLWLLASALDWTGTRNAQGRVVGHQPAKLKLGAGSRSIVQFTDHAGRTVSVVDSTVRLNQAVHKLGAAVTVRYPAMDPSQAEIAGASWLRLALGAAMLVASAAGLLAGGLLLRVSRPSRPAPA